MASITVDGIYENGRVKLVKKPAGVKRARVTVTFLSEDCVEMQASERPQPSLRDLAEPQKQASDSDGRESAEIRMEYGTLIRKKLAGNLTPEETARLTDVRDAINRLDRSS